MHISPAVINQDRDLSTSCYNRRYNPTRMKNHNFHYIHYKRKYRFQSSLNSRPYNQPCSWKNRCWSTPHRRSQKHCQNSHLSS